MLALTAPGCTRNPDESVPIECLQGPADIRAALVQAPGDVRLEGRTKISDCFKQAAPSADVQTLGGNVLAAAEQLAGRVRKAPHSHAAVELGYLMGAVRRGARGDTGIHYETGRRIEQELVGVPIETPEFRRGLEAGRRSG